MKNILTTLMILSFTTLAANASTQVFYGNTGVPSHAQYGSSYTRSIDNFGSNAGFTPQNIEKQRQIERTERHEDQYYNGLEKGRVININTNTYKNNNANNNLNKLNNTTKEIETTSTTTDKSTQSKPKTISRFNKNYKYTPTKKDSKNGVTFYEY